MRIELFNYRDLNFVEFVTGQLNQECSLCNENSKYLHGSVFSIIQSAFELSNPEYSYYETSAFSGQPLTSLRNRLTDHYSRLKNLDSPQSFEAYILKQVEGIDFLNELKDFYPKWKITWENIREQLVQVYEEIIEMVDSCIDDEKVFWVKGY